MRTEGHRRSDNFEDRGRGSGGMGGGGGGGAGILFALLRRIGFRGILIVALVLGGIYFFAPDNIRQAIFGALGLSVPGQTQASGEGQVCDSFAEACDFSRTVLASTEDVWGQQFSQNRLPNYGGTPGAYRQPTLVVFQGAVGTGCGNATSDVGPFYCPADGNLYIDPSFYQVMQSRLNAPGDFAQAYVIAHEVGHHVQSLIGATQRQVPGESQNQTSVRIELQADCLAGVWGHSARSSLAIDEADLREALNAAHAIGDDSLGHSNESQFTHGSSAQRMRWFRAGFDSGDPRRCDTFGVAQGQL